MVRQRERWIDILKGIGMIFVIIGHLDPGWRIETHIYSFHMPLFFWISGYLFLTTSSFKVGIKEYTKKKMTGLLKPYFIYAVLSIFIGRFFHLVKMKNVVFNIKALFFWNGTVGWNSPLWFLVVLFFVEIGYMVLYHYADWFKVNLVMIGMTFIAYFIQSKSMVFPFGWHIVPVGFIFYHLGVCFKKYNTLGGGCSAIKIPILIGLLAVNIIFSHVLNIRISVYHYMYGHFMYFLISAISGILFYAIIAMILDHQYIFELIGKNTLFILATQYMLFQFFSYIGLSSAVAKMVASLSIHHRYVCLILSGLTLGLYIILFYFKDKLTGRMKAKIS